jgi:uncharacterized cupin superfamily protein
MPVALPTAREQYNLVMSERPDPDVTLARLHFDGEERFQRLRAELGVSTFGVNLIRLAPGQRGRIHRHERQEEVYVVLEGELTLLLADDVTHVLGHGGAARVAPEVRRQLVNRGRERLVLLALGGAEPHVGRDGLAYDDWSSVAGRAPQEVPLPPDEPVG